MEKITTTEEAYAAYDESLDEDGAAVVAGHTFTASRALRVLDPTAYRCGFNDWADAYGIDTDELEGDLFYH